MLDSKTFPDDDCHALVANLQFPAIRDRLIADIPGLDEPMQQIQAEGTPKWSRIGVCSATAPACLHPHQP